MGRVPASPSPSKPASSHAFQHQNKNTSPSKQPIHATRPPSSATFNPFLPKTPGFSTNNMTRTTIATTARIPRRHESMLSVNGSPLANPYELGLEWFAEGGDVDDSDLSMIGVEDGGEGDKERRKRVKSIIVRRDPSFSLPSAPIPLPKPISPSTTSHPSNPPPASRSGTLKALITLPTTDGHLLSFDPLRTSPGTLDALEGISDSAKKQAREEMGRLVRTAVDLWKIG